MSRLPDEAETTCSACNDGATSHRVGKNGEKGRDRDLQLCPAAARRLRHRSRRATCGVVAETDPVPFVVAFINDGSAGDMKESLTKALMDVKENADLCRVLETKYGFVPHLAKKN